MYDTIIVGLGNPGKQYENTRHNLGFMAVDAYLSSLSTDAIFKEDKKAKALVADLRRPDKRILLVKPQTFMNESGKAVRAILDYYDEETKNIVVVYDDIDLELGKIRITKSGGAGGHNGIKSLISHLGTKDFLRIKLGVKTKKRDRMPADRFVLGRFGFFDKFKVRKWMDDIVGVITCITQNDAETCMNKYH